METHPGKPALLELVDEHYEALYRYAYRLTGSSADAEDLTQDTFLTVQQKLDQLRDQSRARPWLYKILRNQFLKLLQKAGNQHLISSLNNIAEPVDALPDDFHFDEELIQQVLNQLPEEFRTVVVLYYFQELSYQEIADHLEIPIGTVMSRLARGKKNLRESLSVRMSTLAVNEK